jgi:hypothetical protein
MTYEVLDHKNIAKEGCEMKRSEAIVSLRSLIDPLGQNIPVFLETIR